MEWITSLLKLLNPLSLIGKAWGYFRRPKLLLYFDPNETYHTRAIVDMGGALGFFCHLMVSNDGKQIAKNCRGRLIEVSIPDLNVQFRRHPGGLIEVSIPDSNGQFRCHPDFVNPVALKWAHETDFGPKDIEPDIPRRLDLCYAVQSMPGVLRFFTPKLPIGNRTDFPPSTYCVKVRVDAENAASVDRTFIISYAGIWNQIQVSEAPSQ
jgi:hypothetical protein